MTKMLQKIFGQLETKEQFDALRITIASPEEILSWSHGEVKKPETINYHSLKPEPEGLFCQQIFGPVKDYECACGKYKRMKFRGTICERCGVEVGSASVRRERMGHIKLAMPVAHTWFLREGKIATLLNNLPQKKLEQVISYDAYIVIEPGLTDLKQYDVISDDDYQAAVAEFGADAFHVGIGAEGIREIIANLDMGEERTRLRGELKEVKSETKRKSLIKQLKLVEAFLDSKTEPAWMLPDIIPVIPPDMRPLVTLDAGHVAASDLNDLYRRVIIRNNRLKRFMEMHAPEIIVRNEKRMLQEAVDSLFDNGHKARPMVSQNRRPLKSLSDSLRGKSGRFRMNMLGKRVDYSGRSVIVSGPTLKLHQVGLPKMMALELFKPFVYARLIGGEYASSLKAARKMVENGEDIVWEMLEKVIHEHPVLLNRAPTLHRLSLLAFEPVLIEGKAIRLHPLVCKGFNADFDGDQMSVHVPISLEAQLEARTLMLSSNNVLSPANGEPMIVPSQDMVLGVYYISLINGEHDVKKSPRFANMDEVKLALENKTITLHTPIYARINGKPYATTAGRMILGELLPKSDNMPFDLVNKVMPVKEIKSLLATTYERCGDKDMIMLADALKNTGFEQAARSGISIGYDDIVIPAEKKAMIENAKREDSEIREQYYNGLLSNGERYNRIVDLWQKVTDKLGDVAYTALSKSDGDNWNSVHMMALSGARGSKRQIQQLAGMRGMMQKPDGSIVEVPIISNFKEGLTMSEYFTSTHGARKGMSDTALKTADAGYLTRRLVELAQNTVITEHDCGCGPEDCIEAKPVYRGATIEVPLGDVILGRTAAEDIKTPDGNVIVEKGELVTKAAARVINQAGLESAKVRSVLTCRSDGLCAKCYGMDLSRNALVHVGEAVGVIAGQSIGEPGTQLTLRTFHIGGIAGQAESRDIVIKKGDKVEFTPKFTDKQNEVEPYKLTTSAHGSFADLSAKGVLVAKFMVLSRNCQISTNGGEKKDILYGTELKPCVVSCRDNETNKTLELTTKNMVVVSGDGRTFVLDAHDNEFVAFRFVLGKIEKDGVIRVQFAEKEIEYAARQVSDFRVKASYKADEPTVIATENKERITFATKRGQAKWRNMDEGITVTTTTDPTTNTSEHRISDWRSNTKDAPYIEITDAKGKVVETYSLPIGAIVRVNDGQKIFSGDAIYLVPERQKGAGDITGGLPRVNELLEVRRPSNPAILADIDGKIELDEVKNKILIRLIPANGGAPIEYIVPRGTDLLVRTGDYVAAEEKLTDGDKVPQDILRISGPLALATFMVEQIQQVYRLQGVTINDKHIEILIREMTRRVEIKDPGDTGFLMGQVVDRVDFEEEYQRVKDREGRLPVAEQVLVGLTRASLTSRSFISNASFQQTTKVLVDAAISGSTDKLVGINENLIVGRLIPIGTGAYVRRVREIAKEEERNERLAREGGAQQQLLDI